LSDIKTVHFYNYSETLEKPEKGQLPQAGQMPSATDMDTGQN
jgi:hypothetical protein